MHAQDSHSKSDFIYRLFRDTSEDEINYIYQGQFSNSIVEQIMALAERNLEQTEESAKVKKRVYFIMIECLQNITRYQAEDAEQDEGQALFVLQMKRDKYHITTGNIIENGKVEPLREKLVKVNSLDDEQLKDYYREILTNGLLSEKGGAGLGLIEMARKSGNKLLFDFTPLNSTHSFFYYQAALHRESADPADKITPYSLKFVQEIHGKLSQANISMVLSTFFNQESLMSLMGILESQIRKAPQVKKKFFNILVEMLQNIIHHGASPAGKSNGRPGVFFVSEGPEVLELHSGNLVPASTRKALAGKLDLVNRSSLEELNELYNEKLFDFSSDQGKGAGLGILDMRIKSQQPLAYDLFNTDDTNHDFFTLRVDVKKN